MATGAEKGRAVAGKREGCAFCGMMPRLFFYPLGGRHGLFVVECLLQCRGVGIAQGGTAA